MKTTLIKTNNHYYLEQIPSKGIRGAVFEMMMGSTDGEGYYKLSKQNCDEIFGVVDVEKLAHEFSQNLRGRSNLYAIIGFKAGFNKAMELNVDKRFTLEDMKKAYLGSTKYEWFGDLIKSLQQPTEIEVEIEMRTASLVYKTDEMLPKVDENGCLILKPIR